MRKEDFGLLENVMKREKRHDGSFTGQRHPLNVLGDVRQRVC